MSGICEGRVCLITGAGRGIGREYALMMAAQGAKIEQGGGENEREVTLPAGTKVSLTVTLNQRH